MSILTKEEINFFKENKNEITFELLEALRAHGNLGKQLALDILDLEKDAESYYLDAFENRISFNGNRRLKKPFTKLNISTIHIEEIQRCSENIHYFKDNYVKIRTKSGVNFPEIRQYQNEFISLLNSGEESIVGLMGRQSSKSISTSIYISHSCIFEKERNIGIVANKGSLAREFLANSKNIIIELPIWLQPGVKAWNKSFIEFENDMRVLTDVPSQDSFRGFSIHCAIIDECAFIRPTVFHEFIDAFLPSQAALSWKKNIILSTPKGMNHFYKIVKDASPDFETSGSGLKIKGKSGYALFKVDWRDVPRYDSKGEIIAPDVFKEITVQKHGMLYWQQNFECSFLGSSHTLISTEKLSNMGYIEPINVLTPGLKIYKKPEPSHKYIMSVDPSKDGRDDFAVNIVDITDLKLEQVAAGQLQIDYLLMPEFLLEWAIWFNNAFLVIENNEGSGQSIADMLYKTYEYENLYYDVKVDSNSTNSTKFRKKYPGFRTTSKTRKQILQLLKSFIENDNLTIHDKGTYDQFFTFVLEKEKFQADEGAFDDAIMALALTFAPFISTKNFIDMRLLINSLYKKDEEKTVDLTEIFAIGGFDDGTEANEDYFTRDSSFGAYYGADEVSEFG